MKKSSNLIFLLVSFLIVLTLAACAGPSTVSSTSDSAATAAATSAITGSGTAATSTVDGDALIREKLQDHHGIDRIYTANHTREEWSATIDRMIGYGAQINAQEKEEIINYLMSRQK